jgi:hypothetical protein
MDTNYAVYFILANMFLLICLTVICLHLLSAVHELRRRIAEDPFCRILKDEKPAEPKQLPTPEEAHCPEKKSMYRDKDGKYSRKAYNENREKLRVKTLEDDLQWWALEDTEEGKRVE